ncbi:MAG: nitroreductase family deazaflavin-dependent oxidoreductase [Chloroflexi bacterium]|nr:nitroreductase family deazaflavin-dependent oxidoreductase [Chloroflexota bacterium]
MIWLLRSRFHGVVSGMYLLLTVRGRKSGRLYATPVQYAQQGETLYIITSEGYTWWKNLRGGAEVEVLLRGKTYRAQAITSTDPKTIASLISKIYPRLDAQHWAGSGPGKVAITLTLADTAQQ